MNSFLQDLRFGLRMAVKNPGFSAVAILVLALAIGGTSAMFTILNVLVLRPINAQEPKQLVRFYAREKKPEMNYRSFSYAGYQFFRQENDCFSDILAFTEAMLGVNEGDLTRRTFALMVSANYFSALGVPLAQGRAFSEAEERPGSAVPVVIVSHAYWERTGSDPDLIGKQVRINGRLFEVVGITRPFFTGITVLISPEFWLPLGMYEALANDFSNERKRQLEDPGHHCLRLVGRLRPGVSREMAEQRMILLASRLEAANPAAGKDYTVELAKLSRISMNTFRQEESGPRTASILVLAMAGAVLLIACLNLANMLLARGAARQKEIAVRLSLGGGRLRVIRQLLTESLLLALAGGALGLLLARWANQLLLASLQAKVTFFTVAVDTRPDGRVLLATFGFCLLSVVLFGLGPAWKLSRVNLTSALKEATGERFGGRRRQGLFAPRNLLVTGQLGLSLALLTASVLFTRGAVVALASDPGFSLDRSVLVETDAALGGGTEQRARQACLEALEKVRALPGIESATFGYLVPFGVFSDGREVGRAGSDKPQAQAGQGPQNLYASINIIATDYFRTLGIPLLRGREFDRLEVAATSAARVAIIDETLARELFLDEDPLGHHLRFTGADHSLEIVGVVGKVKDDLTGIRAQPHVYLPFGQEYRSTINFHARVAPGAGEPENAVLSAVREAVQSADPQLAVISVQTYKRFHEGGLVVWFIRTTARLFGVFGMLALFLAVIGVYGVKSYLVSRRTREIGIRMALGATTSDVRWMVLKDGLKTTGLGLVLGLTLSVLVGLGLRGLIYGVPAIDPVAFTVAPLCLAVASTAACYLSARRATQVQPMAALRHE